ncbi:MAG: hypothetical protein C0594_14380 [Marinilabiliales bacterium]|nr:MAG: hypothetical protein C0594_14380 [Marinilabiliales bacterium]
MRSADYNERQRMERDKDYAYSWIQDAIGWISALWGILSKVFSGGGCYITSAIVDYKGLEDNCNYMASFRKLREEMLNCDYEKISKELEQYYIISQILVGWINSRKDQKQIFEFIDRYLINVVKCIEDEKYQTAYDIFKNETLNLRYCVILEKHLQN